MIQLLQLLEFPAGLCSMLWGPLIRLKKFDISILKPCSMHVLNLGLLYASNGACLILGPTTTPAGNPHEPSDICWLSRIHPMCLEMRKTSSETTPLIYVIYLIMGPSWFFSFQGTVAALNLLRRWWIGKPLQFRYPAGCFKAINGHSYNKF